MVQTSENGFSSFNRSPLPVQFYPLEKKGVSQSAGYIKGGRARHKQTVADSLTH